MIAPKIEKMSRAITAMAAAARNRDELVARIRSRFPKERQDLLRRATLYAVTDPDQYNGDITMLLFLAAHALSETGGIDAAPAGAPDRADAHRKGTA